MGIAGNLDLYFIRHGVTMWNVENKYLGHSDLELLQSELSQLEQIKEELQTIAFDTVYCSDLQRCLQTFTYLSIGEEALLEPRLREFNFGAWEGKTHEELKVDRLYQEWLKNWEATPVPLGDSYVKFTNRIDSFLDELLAQHKNQQKRILIVTHGGVIRYIVSKYISTLTFADYYVKNGKGARLMLKHNGEDWTCNYFSEVPSQEKEKL